VVSNYGSFWCLQLIFLYVLMCIASDHHPKQHLDVYGNTFEQQLSSLVLDVLLPVGFEVERFTKLPYLSEGDMYHSYYVLYDAVFVLRPVVTQCQCGDWFLAPDAVQSAIVPRQAVRPSVCSVTLRYDDRTVADYPMVFTVCGLKRHESAVQREHHEILAGIGVGYGKGGSRHTNYVISSTKLYTSKFIIHHM